MHACFLADADGLQKQYRHATLGSGSGSEGRAMSVQVCAGAMLQCSFGVAPASLLVLPVNQVLTGTPAATIMDHLPFVNIAPFGMCNSVANPMVIAATAAALGVPTPMPCIPATVVPWVPGSPTVMIRKMPALNNACKLTCLWGGMIQVTSAGQQKMMVP